MIAPDHDRRADLATPYQFVEGQPGPVALAVAQPADTRRQPLVGDLGLGFGDPAAQRLVFREQLEDRPVGALDVGGIAAERGPAERAFALAEQWADERRHEAGIVEGV